MERNGLVSTVYACAIISATFRKIVMFTGNKFTLGIELSEELATVITYQIKFNDNHLQMRKELGSGSKEVICRVKSLIIFIADNYHLPGNPKNP